MYTVKYHTNSVGTDMPWSVENFMSLVKRAIKFHCDYLVNSISNCGFHRELYQRLTIICKHPWGSPWNYDSLITNTHVVWLLSSNFWRQIPCMSQ